MRLRYWLPMLLALVTAFAGCATQREWAMWRAHSTHYATDDHLSFSVTNAVAGAPRVTPALMETAATQRWWGRLTPRDLQPADVGGTWTGTWTGYGLLRSQRYGLAQATITLNGSDGAGVLALQDSQGAEGIPVALREGQSFGAPIEVTVAQNELWVNGTQKGRPFAATFRLEGDKLVGGFLYQSSPVRIEMVREK
jgi:hypothetical protein